jgi:hypothetical protein
MPSNAGFLSFRHPTSVLASAGIATRLAALIPLRIAQPICFSIEQGVQRFHCSADSVYRLPWRLPLAGKRVRTEGTKIRDRTKKCARNFEN